MPGDDDLIEITWDDLKDVPATPAAPVEELPAVTAADAAVAGGRQPWIDVDAVCARTRASFGVRFTQTGPSAYCFAAVIPKGPTPGGKGFGLGKPGTPPPAGPGMGTGQVNATFSLAGYTGCPQCGMTELIQCDRCATVMCGSAVHQDKKGTWVVCPNCGGKGQVSGGVPVTVQGQVGGMKGGKGGGKKGW